MEDNSTCPACDSVIHQSHPLNYISFDRTMQDIVYKLVPNLQESKPIDFLMYSCLTMYLLIDEIKRERDFYKSRNMPCPKDIPQNHDDDTFNDSHVDSDYHRQDEQVNVCLECKNNINALSRRFIRCSSQATITHLKKFVAKKVLSGMDKYKEVILFRFIDVKLSRVYDRLRLERYKNSASTGKI